MESKTMRKEDAFVACAVAFLVAFLIFIVIWGITVKSIAEQICRQSGRELLTYSVDTFDFKYIVCEPSHSLVMAVG